MEEIRKFYKSFIQEINARQLANEEGDSQEQTFTRYVVDLLAEAGETENADIAYDEKSLGTRNQHKINAYAIADNYETVDLFISIFRPEEEIPRITKDEVEQATRRITNFFHKSIYKDYVNEVAESSQIFEFANTLANYNELRENLVRVNAFIITCGEYKGDFPESAEISGYKIFYRVVDINYIYQISEASRVPIEINFEEEHFQIPCLSASNENDDYQTYIAIIPGQCLANLYERFGARLLEQNVRSFLQFTGKINKGIRDTIKNEPHMFLAFNNGIAATADHIELNESGHFIKKVSNLQIVNGGQTTASIYHTSKKDKADISNIFVQVKFSIVKKQEQFSEIVSRISRYANTQNKVNDADFTANNPSLVALEKLSRYMLTPITIQSNMQTYWFFERARGQYKNLRQKDGFTKQRQVAFDKKYPKKQVFTKVELAKYINAYEEVFDGKKLVIGPHIVVRGNEKNYSRYINNNLPDSVKKINNVYFEDAIAKAILFKTADSRYGTKKNPEYCIGEMKQVTVPYTISLLNKLTNGRLNLYKIWQNQAVSATLSDVIYDLMKQVNQYILSESPGSHYIEWAKKEECWTKVKERTWAFNINDIADDLVDENNPPKRNIVSESGLDEENEIQYNLEIIKSIPYTLWKKIAEWGQETSSLNISQQNLAKNIADNIKYNHSISQSDIRRAIAVYEIVCEHNIELLEEADNMAEQENANTQHAKANNDTNITIELIQKMVEWDKRKHILVDWKWKAMNEVAQGRKPLTERTKFAFTLNLKTLKQHGFEE